MTIRLYFLGPKYDSPMCHTTGCSSDETATSLTDNINKILVADQESRTLIFCGSLFQGSCQKYKMSNISEEYISFSSGVAANDNHSSTYAFIGPERYQSYQKTNILYVGTTFTNNGEYRHDVPAISSRRLDNLDFAEYAFNKQPTLRIDVKYRDHFFVKYVYGFNASDYVYFVIIQKKSHLPEEEELGFESRLARSCINDANYDTYTEVTLQCRIEGTNGSYKLVQDAKVVLAGNDLANQFSIDPDSPVLVAAFSPSKGITNEPQPQSALCIYSLHDIEIKFNENIHMCFNSSNKHRNMGYISGPIQDGECPKAGVSFSPNFENLYSKI